VLNPLTLHEDLPERAFTAILEVYASGSLFLCVAAAFIQRLQLFGSF
jgi:hypothetical protein